jgi:hypothetical protein
MEKRRLDIGFLKFQDMEIVVYHRLISVGKSSIGNTDKTRA